MKLNNDVLVRIKNNDIFRIIKILSLKKIDIKKVIKEDKSFIILVTTNDLKKIKNTLIKKDYEIVKFYGLEGIKNIIKKHSIFISSLLIGVALLLTLTNLIFEIEINTTNETVKKRVEEELAKYGIEEYKFSKSYKKLEEIKTNILKNNNDILEWMSIEKNGIKYVINLNERVKEEETKKAPISDIVASRDGLIMHIEASSGVIVKEIYDYVKKGETIISGNIIKSDKYLKGQVASKGKVYAEVWYTVDISIPYKYVEYVPTGKTYNEYYANIFDRKVTFINKYNIKNVMYDDSLYINKPYIPFKIYKRKTTVYNYKEYNLTEKEAYNLGLKKATDKIKIKLSDDEYIIDKKVLKKTSSSSKMDMRIFFKVYENITEVKEIKKIKVDTDISLKGEDDA